VTMIIPALLREPFFALTLTVSGALILHLLIRRRGSLGQKLLWSTILAIPLLGALLYLAFYDPPPVQLDDSRTREHQDVWAAQSDHDTFDHTVLSIITVNLWLPADDRRKQAAYCERARGALQLQRRAVLQPERREQEPNREHAHRSGDRQGLPEHLPGSTHGQGLQLPSSFRIASLLQSDLPC